MTTVWQTDLAFALSGQMVIIKS